MCPRRRVEIGQECLKKLKETENAAFFLLTNEWCLPAPSVIKPEEREFVVDFRASKHMLSRKDLTSAELETVRASKSPTTVVAANGEVLTKEEANSVCQRNGFIRDSKASRRYTGCSLTRKTLPRSLIFLRVDHWPEATTNSSEMADGSNATRLTTCKSLSLVYRQALQAQLHLHLQHQYRRRQSIPHQQQARVRVASKEYGETRRVPTLHPASTRSESTSGIERVRGDPSRPYIASRIIKK